MLPLASNTNQQGGFQTHGPSWIWTSVGTIQRIYNPPPLTARASTLVEKAERLVQCFPLFLANFNNWMRQKRTHFYLRSEAANHDFATYIRLHVSFSFNYASRATFTQNRFFITSDSLIEDRTQARLVAKNKTHSQRQHKQLIASAEKVLIACLLSSGDRGTWTLTVR